MCRTSAGRCYHRQFPQFAHYYYYCWLVVAGCVTATFIAINVLLPHQHCAFVYTHTHTSTQTHSHLNMDGLDTLCVWKCDCACIVQTLQKGFCWPVVFIQFIFSPALHMPRCLSNSFARLGEFRKTCAQMRSAHSLQVPPRKTQFIHIPYDQTSVGLYMTGQEECTYILVFIV